MLPRIHRTKFAVILIFSIAVFFGALAGAYAGWILEGQLYLRKNVKI
jgi:hypothetical protein